MSKAADLANLIGNINAGGGGVNRNVIINGAMNVAQRGTSSTSAGGSDGYLTLDRWKTAFNSAGRLTMTQDSSAPSGFANSLKLACTTADTSVAAGEYFFLQQNIEGQNLQGFAKGTSDAKPFAVSFWVKGNASATYVAELYDNDNTRQISKTFNVTTDWTRIELTYPADTTGALDDDNAKSLNLAIWLHAGTTYTSGTLNSSAWASNTNANRAAGISSFYDSTSRTFFITGVQLEVGQNPTEFEHEPYATTFEKCLRYFYAVVPIGEGNAYIAPAWMYSSSTLVSIIPHMTEMRSNPTVSTIDASNDFRFYRNNAADDFDEMALSSPSTRRSTAVFNATDVSGTAGHAGGIFGNDATNAYIYLTAEL